MKSCVWVYVWEGIAMDDFHLALDHPRVGEG